MGYYDNIEKAAETASVLAGPSETLFQHYQRQLVDSKQRTEKLEALVELLQNNPETAEILQLMGRL